MRSLQYLDTARLGRASPAAKKALIDFVRHSAEEPSSLYFDAFLRAGYGAWPSRYQRRFPGLQAWNGVASLKQALLSLAGAPLDSRLLLSSGSITLVKIAADAMFRVCRNVLTTDLSWPLYEHTIRAQAQHTENRVTTVALRDDILYRRWKSEDVANHLARAFTTNKCDGLFLPAVDHLGIKLPILAIVKQIQEQSELRFSFIDAAQAFGHISLDESVATADFIVAGCHKWIGAYLPTAISIFGKSKTRELIRECLRRSLNQFPPLDPLLTFTEQLENSEKDDYAMTANLSPLFACAGAASDWVNCSASVDDIFTMTKIAQVPSPSQDWQPVCTHADFSTRIVVFESPLSAIRREKAETICRAWLNGGCIVTAYDGGRARVSLPPRWLT